MGREVSSKIIKHSTRRGTNFNHGQCSLVSRSSTPNLISKTCPIAFPRTLPFHSLILENANFENYVKQTERRIFLHLSLSHPLIHQHKETWRESKFEIWRRKLAEAAERNFMRRRGFHFTRQKPSIGPLHLIMIQFYHCLLFLVAGKRLHTKQPKRGDTLSVTQEKTD